ncbi:MAG TPA: T9SS type A sorting domain-containing protein [Parafilimonas sp.]
MKTNSLLVPFFFCFLFNKTNAQFAFTRDIKDATQNIRLYYMLVTDANNSIIATRSPDVVPYGGGYLSKFNFRGKLVWSKNYSFFSPYIFNGFKILPAENDGFISIASVQGNFDDYGSVVFKADSNGNTIWIKRLSPNTKKYNIIPLGGVYASNKNIYVINLLVDSGLLIQKLNLMGELLWNRYLLTDSILRVETQFVFATTTQDDGLIISTTTSKLYESRRYNHFYKISKNGDAEWAYEIKQDTDYVSGITATSANDDRLNILYTRNYEYAYSTLNVQTGQSKTYKVGKTIFDLQSYLRNNDLNVFNGLTFPYNGGDIFNVYAFTENKSFVEASQYEIGLTKNISRIELFDSLGRICPDFTIPVSHNIKTEIKLKYTKSSFHFSPSPVKFVAEDTVLNIQDINTVNNICAGKPPSFTNSNVLNNTAKDNLYKLNIFPNPVITKLNMNVDIPLGGIATIDIIDLNGKILKSQSIITVKGKNSITLNMSDILTGLYAVRFSSSYGAIVQKVVKQ